MTDPNIALHPSWLAELEGEFQQPYMQQLQQFLEAEKQAGKLIYPTEEQVFAALNLTPLEQAKVVILGQDPYHGPGQAHGLCFSVLPGVKIPPSLLNVYKEIQRDFGYPIPAHGCLQYWAQQGVLLLNATLTVEAGLAGSHQGRGWEQFTDRLIALLNARRDGLVFMLWGSYAQKKGRIIDPDRHCILQSPHPSPLSAHRGFLGNAHFSTANAYLRGRGIAAVDWRIS